MTESRRFIGYIDRIDCNAINGWAYDTENPDASVIVEAVYNNGRRTLALASCCRQDVHDAGYGTGWYGFTIPIASLGSGDSLIVRFFDSKHLISRDPIIFDPLLALLSHNLPSAFGEQMILMAAKLRQSSEIRTSASGTIR